MSACSHAHTNLLWCRNCNSCKAWSTGQHSMDPKRSNLSAGAIHQHATSRSEAPQFAPRSEPLFPAGCPRPERSSCWRDCWQQGHVGGCLSIQLQQGGVLQQQASHEAGLPQLGQVQVRERARFVHYPGDVVRVRLGPLDHVRQIEALNSRVWGQAGCDRYEVPAQRQDQAASGSPDTRVSASTAGLVVSTMQCLHSARIRPDQAQNYVASSWFP